jgi:hypothetical protein
MPRVEVTEILAAARSWLGTPWRHQDRLQGVAVDCGGLILGVGRELGLLDFDTRAYGRIPDGQQLRALCEQHLISKPAIEAAPGDVLLMRFTRHPQHLAIVGARGEPFTLTDHAIVAVYTTLDDTSEVWDLIPMTEFLLENTTDPNRISFLVTGVYKFRVGVRRSGSTDTITSADLSLRKDGVNA